MANKLHRTVDQCIGILILFLSFVSGFDASGDTSSPRVPTAAVFHASET
jgi:hypothetical protein